MPHTVSGIVVSVESRVVPETGRIVTDVGVLESPSGDGTAPTHFAMEGGVVGRIGMRTERFTDLHVGDSVVAKVIERGGTATAIAAPVVVAKLPDLPAGSGYGVSATTAGYVWDGLHWEDGRMPVAYSVNPTGLPSGAALAVVSAAQTWEDDPGSYMDFNYTGTTAASSGVLDGVNVVGSGLLETADAVAGCVYWYDTTTLHITEFDITYNTGTLSFATDGNPAAFDVQGIGTHEFGHALGLGHPDDPSQVMYYASQIGDTDQRTLAWGDIAGVRTIYPVSGDHTPIAVPDASTVVEAGTLAVAAPGVLGNDTDAHRDALTADLVTGVAHGALSLHADGSYDYRPAAGFFGQDSFTYRASDGAAYSNTVRVTITVTRKSTPTWKWQNPRPQGNELCSVDFIDAARGWAVGAGSAISMSAWTSL